MVSITGFLPVLGKVSALPKGDGRGGQARPKSKVQRKLMSVRSPERCVGGTHDRGS